MWSARQTWKMGRRAAGFLGGLLATILVVAAPAAAASVVEGPINVSTSALYNSAAIRSEFPAIAVTGAGQVVVAWKEGNEIYFRRSQPTQGSCGGGLKFDEPKSLWAGGTVAPSGPALAANENGGVFVAWQASSAVLFRRSTNHGQDFDAAIPLGPNSSAANAPSMAADTGGVFVAWSNGSFPAEIFFARSTSAGAANSFQVAANVSGSPFVHSRAPSVATDGTSVFVAWEEGTNGFGAPIRLRKFGRQNEPIGAGSVLMDPLLGTGLSDARNPHLAFADGVLSVAFVNMNLGPTGLQGSVYHRSSSNGGTTFSSAQKLSGPGVPQNNARAARGNHSGMVAWSQRLGETEATTEIQYWLAGATTEQGSVSATPGAKSVNPATAVDSTGRLLWAWQETVNGSDEIYLSYSGGTATEVPNAIVDMNPQTLNAKTMYQGQGVFTLRIRFTDGSAVDYPLSLQLNGVDVVPLRSSLDDTDGNGVPDTLELKIKRSELQGVFDGATLTAAQGNGGSYDADVKVKGNMTGGRCFSGKGDVRIIHQ